MIIFAEENNQTMKNTTIKTNLFRVRYRRDDGTKQLKVLDAYSSVIEHPIPI